MNEQPVQVLVNPNTSNLGDMFSIILNDAHGFRSSPLLPGVVYHGEVFEREERFTTVLFNLGSEHEVWLDLWVVRRMIHEGVVSVIDR